MDGAPRGLLLPEDPSSTVELQFGFLLARESANDLHLGLSKWHQLKNA